MIRRKQVKYEIQKSETVYVLKLSAKELQYLAHAINQDECACGADYCVDTAAIQSCTLIMDIARSERLSFR